MWWLLAVVTNLLATAPDEVDDVVARLAGHRVEVAADRRSLTIVDVAGEGAPRIGVIERVGDGLELVADDGRWRLAGPLARPRIAGPGYTVWVIGEESLAPEHVPTLTIRRLGVLRRPQSSRAHARASNQKHHLRVRRAP